MANKKPLLSIGIIFKNEIRCLDRCLKSFQALREAMPCEVVMADTGSTDGSREIAEKYADVLFDFPWVKDFAAARNAVMDRSSGLWYLTVDADEWLDEDISQLCAFLRVCDRAPENSCTIKLRNYATEALDWNYTEFMATRMVRMSSGVRYAGRVHEHFDFPPGQYTYNALDKVILHHDGYVCLNNGSPIGKQKVARNLELLEAEIREQPHNMRLLMERMDCCTEDYAQRLEYARQAQPGIKEHWEEWDAAGPHIIRHAVRAAQELRSPEIADWVAFGEEVFPNSIFIRTDVQYLMAGYARERMDSPEVIRRGEKYLQGVRDYRNGKYNLDDLRTGTLHTIRPHTETDLRPALAISYLYEGQPDKALETLQNLDYDTMNVTQTGMLTMTMLRLQTLSSVDTAPLMREIWEKIRLPKPNKELAALREQKLLTVCSKYFTEEFRESERKRLEDPSAPLPLDLNAMTVDEWKILSKLPTYRYGYTLFLPLLGQSELGAAAAILNTEDPEEMAKFFSQVESVQGLPVSALQHMLNCGVTFPLAERPLNLEEMDSLSSRLVHSNQAMVQQAAETDISAIEADMQALCWARGMILSAVQQFPWDREDADTALGLALAHNFARVEKSFVQQCFSPNALQTENLFMLPPMHRFGWRCAQAFDLLEQGDAAGYVRALRQGLDTCKDMKAMVEFLVDHTEALQAPPPPPELLALAEQVRMLMSQYPADHPAILALKESEAYQKVAQLIEGK